MLPLITEKHIALTHLIVCSFHINEGQNLTLNDYVPHHPIFSTLWAETQIVKAAGVKVMGMIGGASAGSWTKRTLDGDAAAFEFYYSQLYNAIREYGLQGMDLDVEQPMSLDGIIRLIRRLRNDFGPDFIITLSPVATAFYGGSNLSGFSYTRLDMAESHNVNFWLGQFYNGFGWLGTTASYDQVMTAGWDTNKIVIGQVTAAENGGGFVRYEQLNETITTLRRKYGEIGGIMGWEYFNSHPGGLDQPWEWARVMTAILRPNMVVPEIRVTKEDAEVLTKKWYKSVNPYTVSGTSHNSFVAVPPAEMNIDYFAMVNA